MDGALAVVGIGALLVGRPHCERTTLDGNHNERDAADVKLFLLGREIKIPEYIGDERGGVGDVDLAIPVHIGIVLVDEVIATQQIGDEVGGIGDVDLAVAVHVTTQSCSGLQRQRH